MKRGPKPRYQTLVKEGALAPDRAQEEAVDRLQSLHKALQNYRPPTGLSLFSAHKTAPKGVYLWGGVGRGKTLLMDLFFNNTAFPAKRRVHFHEFMAEGA